MNNNFFRIFCAKSLTSGSLKVTTAQRFLFTGQSTLTSLTYQRCFRFISVRALENCQITSRWKSSVFQQTRHYIPIRSKEIQVLYTNNKLRYLRWVNLFGFTFTTYWFFTAYQYATMNISPEVPKGISNLPWYLQYDVVNSVTAKYSFLLLSLILGSGVLWCTWMYSSRYVGKVILGKDGQTVTLITYNPLTFRMNRSISVKLNEISCQGHRSVDDTVPVKVKGRLMHFLLMKDGAYQNAPLFDRTVGLKRQLY